MFAFAAADFERQQVMLARDRLGKKPLYYAVENGVLAWSSELEPLYRDDWSIRDGSRGARSVPGLAVHPVAADDLQGVRALPPGHVATVDLRTGNVEERRYWHLTFPEDRSLSVDEWGERLDDAIRDAVTVRFMSDVPFGAFLSGGIDSSLVVAYMAELMQQPVKTFTIGFRKPTSPRCSTPSRSRASHGTEHHTEIVEADSMGLLPLLVQHYGQPFADSSAIPTYYVSRMASQHVKMVLSGDGGDENFAGYNSYEYVVGQMQQAQRARQPARQARVVPRSLRGRCTAACVAAARPQLDELYHAALVTAHHFSPAERRQLLTEALRPVVREFDRTPALLDVDGAPIVTRLQHLDLMAYLPFDILTKVDIAAMANSLEVRVPLLDHHVVELAATMPTEHKLKPLADGFERKHC